MRERQRKTERDIERQRKTERERKRQTERDIERQRKTERERKRQTDKTLIEHNYFPDFVRLMLCWTLIVEHNINRTKSGK